MTSPLASAAVVAYCGWDPLTPVINQTVSIDGNGTRKVFLPSLYVTAVTAVVVTTPWNGSTYTATLGPGGDVTFNTNGVLTWISAQNCGAFPEGDANISVTYSGGYTSAPEDLLAAVESISSRMPLQGATSTRLGSAGIGYGAQVSSGGLLLIEQMVLDRYKIVRAG